MQKEVTKLSRRDVLKSLSVGTAGSFLLTGTGFLMSKCKMNVQYQPIDTDSLKACVITNEGVPQLQINNTI